MIGQRINMTFEEADLLERDFIASHNVPQWSRDNDDAEKTGFVLFLGAVYRVIGEPARHGNNSDSFKYLPPNSSSYALIPSSAIKHLYTILKIDVVDIVINRGQLWAWLQDTERQSFTQLFYAEKHYAKSNMGGVGDYGLRVAAKGLLDHHDLQDPMLTDYLVDEQK